MTPLAKLSLTESAKLDFGIEISGTDSKPTDIRLIIETPMYGIVCKCTESAGVITADIPALNGILKPGNYVTKLEILVDGKYFQPLSESIQFLTPITVNAKLNTQNEIALRSPVVAVRQVKEPVAVVEHRPMVVPASSSFKDYEKIARLNEMTEKIRAAESRLKTLRSNLT